MPSEEHLLPCAPNCRRGAHDRRCGHESPGKFVDLFGSEQERVAFVVAAKGHAVTDEMVERATRAWLEAEFGEDAEADDQWPHWSVNMRRALAAALDDHGTPA